MLRLRSYAEAWNEPLAAVVTTHYGGIRTACHRYKVRGFRDDLVHGPLGVERLNEYIDYRLEPDEHGEVPHEALRIAQLMGLDDELLASCRAFLGNDAQGGE